MTADDTVLLEIADHVATVTLNRPEKLNALNPELLDALPGVLERVAGDPQVRCVILTGAGRGFCAGGDISAMAAGVITENPVERLRRQEESSRLLHEMPKPTIAMINGPAAGAGLSLALCCDLRIAAESARLGTAFARVGFSGDFGGTWMLQRLLGPAKARELYFTAGMLDAREAERLGIVNRAVRDDGLRDETMALAQRIAAGPPIALARMKQNMNLALVSDFTTLLHAEAEGMIMTGMTRDHREAARAFLEKREPTFEGR
ncbi:MAG: enoyl-CoA hydratase [Dehalococcoidia bacterium]|nr:enoyl-CoA hydratase [Dehalococcoidia bacterium]